MKTVDIGPIGLGMLRLHRSFDVAYCSHDRRDLLHVMSPSAGGQVCGYARTAGSSDPWAPWLPWRAGEWPELHQAVARLTGEAVEVDGRRYPVTVAEQLQLFAESTDGGRQ